MIARAQLFTFLLIGSLIGAACYIWIARGPAILLDLSAAAAAFCL